MKKIFILKNELECHKNGTIMFPSLTSVNTEILDSQNIEVRNIWQPWIRRHCTFAVRYILPIRPNIIEIMKASGQILHQVLLEALKLQRHPFVYSSTNIIFYN